MRRMRSDFPPDARSAQNFIPDGAGWSGLDPPGIAQESINLRSRALQNSGTPNQSLPRDTQPPSENDAIGTKDTELTDQLLAFMKVSKPTN